MVDSSQEYQGLKVSPMFLAMSERDQIRYLCARIVLLEKSSGIKAVKEIEDMGLNPNMEIVAQILETYKEHGGGTQGCNAFVAKARQLINHPAILS